MHDFTVKFEKKMDLNTIMFLYNDPLVDPRIRGRIKKSFTDGQIIGIAGRTYMQVKQTEHMKMEFSNGL